MRIATCITPCSVEQHITAASPNDSAEYWRVWTDYPAEKTGVPIHEFLAVLVVMARADELGTRDRWRTLKARGRQLSDIVAPYGEEDAGALGRRARQASLALEPFRLVWSPLPGAEDWKDPSQFYRTSLVHAWLSPQCVSILINKESSISAPTGFPVPNRRS